MNKVYMLLIALLLFTESRAQRFYFDSMLEDSVMMFLQDELRQYGWLTGQAVVMETKTGRIKARVALQHHGEDSVPYHDAYDREQEYPMSAANYLALMASNKVTPDMTFDTGNGVWDGLYDHNWRRGGYGQISLERALAVNSVIALQMAMDSVFATDMQTYEKSICRYHGGFPNQQTGILTFYNAVANGGRMLRPISHGRTIVVEEQFESKQAIEHLQRALRLSVKEGVFKNIDIPETEVAASGRTFPLNSKIWRLELCGYFPFDNPQYTVMVILEKEGLPASAGAMCGQIFKRIVRYLM